MKVNWVKWFKYLIFDTNNLLENKGTPVCFP